MLRSLARSEIEPVLAPFERARPLPGRAYHDEALYDFEQAEIFGHAWVCVGHENDVALPGQWIRETVAGESVLVVRGADLRLRAFFDVCRHRGASLVGRTPCGRGARFQCPYHGWAYELDGRLVEAPFAPPEVAREKRGLREVRVEVWHGFVFLSLAERTSPRTPFDSSSTSLERWLGTTPPWLSTTALATLRRGRRVEYEVLANWKLCVQNFQESHHFPHVHRPLERLTPTAEARSWLTRGPWLGGTMEIDSAETVSLDGSRHGRPLVGTKGRVFDAMLFPTLFTSLQPDYFLTYRLCPLASGRTRIVADVYFHSAAFVPDFDPRDVYEFWDRVNAEDRTICENQQRNVASRAFEPCYVTVEEGVHAFDRMVATVHGGSVE